MRVKTGNFALLMIQLPHMKTLLCCAALVSNLVAQKALCQGEAPPVSREFRGVWVATVANIDWPSKPGLTACRAAFEHLKRPGASIINISATQAFVAMALQAHVCAAKAGVDMLTRTLAIEWGPMGVRVNSIAPGAVDDTEGMRRLAPTPESRKFFEKMIPLRRFAQKSELADLALFLSSDAAQFITGAVMVCDGGQSSGASLPQMTQMSK